MDAAAMADVWFVFSICCLVAALLGSVRWLLLTRPPKVDAVRGGETALAAAPASGAYRADRGGADCPHAGDYSCPDDICFACVFNRRII